MEVKQFGLDEQDHWPFLPNLRMGMCWECPNKWTLMGNELCVAESTIPKELLLLVHFPFSCLNLKSVSFHATLCNSCASSTCPLVHFRSLGFTGSGRPEAPRLGGRCESDALRHRCTGPPETPPKPGRPTDTGYGDEVR